MYHCVTTLQHKERITTLEQQLAAKDAILEQLRNDLREKEEAKDKLGPTTILPPMTDLLRFCCCTNLVEWTTGIRFV